MLFQHMHKYVTFGCGYSEVDQHEIRYAHSIIEFVSFCLLNLCLSVVSMRALIYLIFWHVIQSQDYHNLCLGSSATSQVH